ncbi:MAG: Ribosome-binding factor A [Clostridia bacterium 41_269]|nr:MAG: Ribosome-binding factor A [Clostridia bacterium 41_269]
MNSYRASRVAEQMKKEVSQIIQEELKDPRIGFVTVTGVDISNDLRHAKIYISILSSGEEETKTMEALNNAKGFIRSEIGKRIRLRFTPEIIFKLDKSLERGAYINRLITQVNQGEED